MGCKRLCIVDIGNRKCCMECERHEECNILCDDLDQYEYMEECEHYKYCNNRNSVCDRIHFHEYMEECPNYVKENEDENCKR